MIKELLHTDRGYQIPCEYAIDGKEKMVCIIAHGFGSSKASPTAQMLLEALPKEGICAIAFDFPAHGESPVDGDFLRMENCFSDIASVEKRAQELAPCAEIVYFGSSFGAYTTLLYLSTRPHAGKKAFLRSAAVCMPELFLDPTPEQQAELNASGFILLGEDYGYARPLKLTQGFLDDLANYDVFTRWNPGEAKLHMIHGDSDETIPFAEACTFSRKFSVPLTVVTGGDHRLSIPGAPQRVLHCALEFFLSKDE